MRHTQDYKVGYSRGYQAGCRDRWPAHKPPTPPEPVIGELVEALRALRDCMDSQAAQFDPSDEFVTETNPSIARADKSLEAVTQWLMAETPPLDEITWPDNG